MSCTKELGAVGDVLNVVAPVAAGIFAPELLGVVGGLGGAAVGAAAGGLTSVLTGGKFAQGALAGAVGGFAGTYGAAAAGTQGDMAAMYQTLGLSPADAMTAAEAAQTAGMSAADLAGVLVKSGSLTASGVGTLTGNTALAQALSDPTALQLAAKNGGSILSAVTSAGGASWVPAALGALAGALGSGTGGPTTSSSNSTTNTTATKDSTGATTENADTSTWQKLLGSQTGTSMGASTAQSTGTTQGSYTGLTDTQGTTTSQGGSASNTTGTTNSATQGTSVTATSYSPEETLARANLLKSAGEAYAKSQAGVNPEQDAAFANNITQRLTDLLENSRDINSNPYLQDAITAATRAIDAKYLDPNGVLANIRSGALQAGQYGGTRQGLGEGIAATNYLREVGDVAAKMNNDAYQQGQQNYMQTLLAAPGAQSTLQQTQQDAIWKPAQNYSGMLSQLATPTQTTASASATAGSSSQNTAGTSWGNTTQDTKGTSSGTSAGATTGTTLGTTSGTTTSDTTQDQTGGSSSTKTGTSTENSKIGQDTTTSGTATGSAPPSNVVGDTLAGATLAAGLYNTLYPAAKK